MHNASHGYPVPHITKDKTKNIMKFDILSINIKSDGSDFWVKYSDSAWSFMKKYYEKWRKKS